MIDLIALKEALERHGRVARVVVAGVDGSAPREAGAEMLVWAEGQSGTIGGGALEWEAASRARELLEGASPGPGAPSPIPSHEGRGGDSPATAGKISAGKAPPSPLGGEGWDGGAPTPETTRIDRIPLGPQLGQCCGGAVTLVTEVWDRLPQVQAGLVVRRVQGAGEMPLGMVRMLDRARARGEAPSVTLTQGWLAEAVAVPRRQLWIWGAGHVGRALVAVMAPLPGVAITWADVAEDRFPLDRPAGVTCRWAADPGALVESAPQDAEHLILTFSHALDLDLCHRLLSHGFARCGLIGSGTKWARFRSRLTALGHPPAAIARIRCPIGNPALGKHPQAIAIGVAAEFLAAPAVRQQERTA